MKNKLLIIFSLMLCFIIGSVSVSAAETELFVHSFTDLDEWSGSSAAAKQLSLNTDESFIKTGEASLCLTYPVSTGGSTFNVTNVNWRSGGLALPAAEDGMIINKIGIWIYMSEADSNIQVNLRTKGSPTAQIVDSASKLLDFEGWGYVTFDVDKSTSYIYSIVIKRVQSQPNTEEKQIYLDSINAVYGYDTAMKQELSVTGSIMDGAEGIAPSTSELLLEFSNPIDENNMFNAAITPETEFELEKVSQKAYKIKFTNGLQSAVSYNISITGITDVYDQTMDASIGFTTSVINMQIISMKSSGENITDITAAGTGTLDIGIGLSTSDESLLERDMWLVCSALDSNNKMTGVCLKPIRIEQNTDAVLSMTLTAPASECSIFLLDALDTRNVIECIRTGGE